MVARICSTPCVETNDRFSHYLQIYPQLKMSVVVKKDSLHLHPGNCQVVMVTATST